MNSITIGRYRSTNAKALKGGHQKPFIITQGISNHRNGHYVRPNMVALKYPNFKMDVDLDVHVIVFKFVMKANAKTFEKYMFNSFSYMLRDMALDWCHNYMSKFLEYIFSKLTHAFCKHH
jgi:hypothetical protein